MEDQTVDATSLIDSTLDESGRLIILTSSAAERVARLKKYRGNRVRWVVVVIDSVVPNLFLLMESVAHFLRHHRFSNVPRPTVLIYDSSIGDPGFTREQFVTIVDLLIEALCDNILLSRVFVCTKAAPSSRLIHRLVQEKSGPPNLTIRDESILHVGDPEDGVAFNTLVTLQDSDRTFRIASSVSEAESVFGSIVTFQGAAKALCFLDPPALERVTNALLPAPADVIVPHVSLGRLEVSGDMLDGAAVYEKLSDCPALRRITLRDCTFVGRSSTTVPPLLVSVDQEEVEEAELPLIDLRLGSCGMGRQAVSCFLSRPISSLIFCGRIPSAPSNLIDDFLVDLCHGQPSLCALSLGDTELGTDEMTSFCDFLSSPGCRISTLTIGGMTSDNTPVLSDDCVAIFFQQLGRMLVLKNLSVEHPVTTPQLGDTITKGVRENVFLWFLQGLKISVECERERLLKEILFWTLCNRRGRCLVEEHLAQPTKIPIAVFAKIFYRCSLLGDNLVLFQFLRQLVPSLLNCLDSQRSRRRERRDEAVDGGLDN